MIISVYCSENGSWHHYTDGKKDNKRMVDYR